MKGIEGLHGDWQHMTGEEAEEAALAVGGEGAVELEATAPQVEVLDPLNAEEREALRRRISTDMDRPHIDPSGLVSGPDGQMISGHNR